MNLLFTFLFVCNPNLLMGYTIETSTDSISPYRHFDFWIGEWTVYNYGTDQVAGYNSISVQVDSFVIQESYQGVNGKFKGMSLNKFDPSRQVWDQFWVDNSGVSLHLSGTFEEGKMVLSGERKTTKGMVLDKIQWTPLEDKSVRQEWLVSQDNGANWQKVFDGHYKKK